jgi:sarcosine oxidase
MRAREVWRGLEERAGEELLIETGGIDSGPGAEECAAALEACGVPGEWWSAGETEERFPGISLPGQDRVLWHPMTGVCLADRAVAAQVRLAREAGVDVREETPLTGVEPAGDGVVVHTGAGEVRADTVVLAGGGWNRWMLAGALESFQAADRPLPLATVPEMLPTLQQVSYFAPTDPATMWPVLIEWGLEDWYMVPPVGGAAGVKVGLHVAGRLVDPSDGPFPVDPELEHVYAAHVRRHLPGADPAPVRTETCLYTMTSDEDFVIDRVGPLVLFGGCSGHGFKFGPVIGEILADLATGRDPGIPKQRFSALRPALERAFAV